MALDYSQKRLISAPLRSHHKKGPRQKKLERYAFYTGLVSTILSLVTTILQAGRIHS